MAKGESRRTGPDKQIQVQGKSENPTQRDFARKLTREVFGRYYWNDRLEEEKQKALKKRK